MQPGESSRGRTDPTRTIVAVGALIAVVVLGMLWFGNEEPSQRLDVGGSTVALPAPSASSAPSLPAVATRWAKNREGGYSFRYPKRWRMTRIGVVTEIRSPGSGTVVNIGRGSRNPPRRIAEALFGLTRRLDYRKVERLGSEARRFAGGRAHLIAARALNAELVPLHILFVAVDRGPKSYPITIFTAVGTDPGRVLPRVEAIAASVRAWSRG